MCIEESVPAVFKYLDMDEMKSSTYTWKKKKLFMKHKHIYLCYYEVISVEISFPFCMLL